MHLGQEDGEHGRSRVSKKEEWIKWLINFALNLLSLRLLDSLFVFPIGKSIQLRNQISHFGQFRKHAILKPLLNFFDLDVFRVVNEESVSQNQKGEITHKVNWVVTNQIFDKIVLLVVVSIPLSGWLNIATFVRFFHSRLKPITWQLHFCSRLTMYRRL